MTNAYEMDQIAIATEKFGSLIASELKRIAKMKEQKDFVNFKELDKIIIGVADGDGIGPIIIEQAKRVLNFLHRQYC